MSKLGSEGLHALPLVDHVDLKRNVGRQFQYAQTASVSDGCEVWKGARG